jgi:teichuronic acid biosynthesis glycosyltransferase TuaH
MKKILYLTTTDWGWAKQRPHFIAEGLSSYFYVKYAYLRRYQKKNMVINTKNNDLHFYQIFRFPFETNPLIKYVNKIIVSLQIYFMINKFDIIWISHPYYFDLTKNMIPSRSKLIYDCMDDHLEFPENVTNRDVRNKLFVLEKNLVERADITIASSDYLRSKIIERYRSIQHISVINNAISDKLIEDIESVADPDKLLPFGSSGLTRIVYIGTISEWMNFNLILRSLDKYENIEYLFFGPSYIEIPKHERLKYYGPIDHDQVINAMKIADLLVMPFRKTELILSVNPVKVYEYIFAHKPTLILKYSETIKFQEYVYLYDSEEDYLNYIELLIMQKLHPKQDMENCRTFAGNNTWSKRIQEVLKLVQGI